MHDLYNGVIVLGRSITMIDRTGWECGSLGTQFGPKCVNGIVSMSGGTLYPKYIDEVPGEMHGPVRLAAVALIETCPSEIREAWLTAWALRISEAAEGTDENDQLKKLLRILQEPQTEQDLGELGNMLALLNDRYTRGGCPILNKDSARAWFERAFDKLAAQLPEPLPPRKTFTEIVEEAVAAINSQGWKVPTPA